MNKNDPSGGSSHSEASLIALLRRTKPVTPAKPLEHGDSDGSDLKLLMRKVRPVPPPSYQQVNSLTHKPPIQLKVSWKLERRLAGSIAAMALLTLFFLQYPRQQKAAYRTHTAPLSTIPDTRPNMSLLPRITFHANPQHPQSLLNTQSEYRYEH